MRTFAGAERPDGGVGLEIGRRRGAWRLGHGGDQGRDGNMQTEGHSAVGSVVKPDGGVESDDLGAAHQDDIHNDRHAVVLRRRVHEVAVLAHHAHRHVLHRHALIVRAESENR